MKKQLFFLASVLLTLNLNAQIYMYGTTSEGGANNLGTIYRVDKNGQNFQKLFDFSTATGGNPYAGLTLAGGKLYGFTTTGGQITNPGAVIALGTFYEFDPINNTLSVIEYIDDQSSIGNGFNHAPTLGSDGKLYFASPNYGLGGLDGILSSYSPSTGLLADSLAVFTNTYGQPKSKLLSASDGNLYVTTNNSALFGNGAIVKYDVTNANLVHLFSSNGNGTPYFQFESAQNNELFESSNGVLWGCSRQGGNGFNSGIVFKINKDGTGYQTMYQFNAAISDEGFWPEGGFIEKDGVLYSSTPQERIENVNSGTLFTVDTTTGNVSFIHTLDLEGSKPKGVFTESTNGRFYLTCSGGSGDLIEYNPANGNITNRHSFSSVDGTKPQNDQLAIVDFNVLSVDETSLIDDFMKIYPNPVQDIINIKITSSDKIEAIKILDLKGSELYIDESKTKESVINTSFLSSGVYLLYIKTNTGSTTRKIIKE